MKSFNHNCYKIDIYTNITEWAKEFYGMSDDAILVNTEDVNNDYMGFAELENKKISIFIPNNQNDLELSKVVAHEVGHIIEGGFKKNPAARMINLHERKAEHYENYFVLVNDIINKIKINLENSK
jgi:hypothetical protein